MRRRRALRAFLRLGLFGSGMDNYGLLGPSKREVKIYHVQCDKGHTYDSFKWPNKCKKCGAKVTVTEEG